jgi:hypothetical protein
MSNNNWIRPADDNRDERAMFTLTITHLRFVCEAVTPLRLEADTFRAGSNLRGALGQVMTRAYCAGERNAPGHAAACPVCWLLAANLKPGEERRGYGLVPPLETARADCLNPSESFEFGLTLFGSALQFLPYFVLAVPEMGRMGVGPGRGKFRLKRVWALDPLTGESECLLAENSSLVHTPTLRLDHAQVVEHAQTLLPAPVPATRPQPALGQRGAVTIEFLTPMRLIADRHTAKVPDFATLFARLLKRLDELEEQHAQGRGRAEDEVRALEAVAARVQLTEVQTRWVEVWSGSNRRGAPSPLSGFVGRATFAASPEDWQLLLPWLVWGELVQVGKDTVKGNGVMRVAESQ